MSLKAPSRSCKLLCGCTKLLSVMHRHGPHAQPLNRARLMHTCACTCVNPSGLTQGACVYRFSLGRMAHPPYAPAAALKFLISGKQVCYGSLSWAMLSDRLLCLEHQHKQGACGEGRG